LQNQLSIYKTKLEAIEQQNTFVNKLKEELLVVNPKILDLVLTSENKLNIITQTHLKTDEKKQISNFIKLKGEYNLLYLQEIH